MEAVDLDVKLGCRIVEAKNLRLPKAQKCDPYCKIQVGDDEWKTPVIYNTSSPFWSSEHVFENFTAGKFKRLSATIYSKSGNQSETDYPVGQVIFPSPLITSGQLKEEQWFSIVPVDVENTVSGDIRLKLHYYPPSDWSRAHTFVVNVISARDLVPRSSAKNSNPYLALHLLPDHTVSTTQVTRPIARSLNPVYNETFIFSRDSIDYHDLELHASVWHATAQGLSDVFMGHTSIPLKPLIDSQRPSDKWYTLFPKPGHIANMTSSYEKRLVKKAIAIAKTQLPRPKMFALAFQSADIGTSRALKSSKLHKFVDTKLTSMCYCGHCSGIIWTGTNQLQCKECRVICHPNCSRVMSNNCGKIGMIRLKITYSVLPVMAELDYDPFLQIISSNNYSLCTLLGKVSNEREDVAIHAIKIFESKKSIVAFLKALVQNEIASASEPETLFRANSMASKAIDVYMKKTAQKYLNFVIRPFILRVLQERKNCEIDPSRIDPKSECSIEDNWKTLENYMADLTSDIFGSADFVPGELREVFQELQFLVFKKFPKHPEVKYTGISGFFFLRLVAPSILNPQLFGLTDEYFDTQIARTLTLVAKIIQNLANLVEFGQKEPYMERSNEFIVSRVKFMKHFLEQISTTDEKYDRQIINNDKSDSINVAKISARLLDIYVRSAELLVTGSEGKQKKLVSKLLLYISKITGNRSFVKRQRALTAASTMTTMSTWENNKDEELIHREEQIRLTTRFDSALNTIQEISKPSSHNSRDSNILNTHEAPQVAKNVAQNRDSKTLSLILGDMPAINPDNEDQIIALSELRNSLVLDKSDIEETKLNESPKDISYLSPVFENSNLNQKPKCTVCSRKIGFEETSVIVDGKPFCSEHAPKDTYGVCAGCEETIKSSCISALGKLWHSNCLVCAECGCNLEQGFKEYEDQPYCEEDFNKRAGLVCATCSEDIKGEYASVMGKNYHPKCIICDHCGCSIANKKYFSLHGRIICNEHKAELLNCHTCKQPIKSGQIVIAMKKQYQFHAEHFVCNNCGTSLESLSYHERNDHPFCQNCWITACIDDLSLESSTKNES